MDIDDVQLLAQRPSMQLLCHSTVLVTGYLVRAQGKQQTSCGHQHGCLAAHAFLGGKQPLIQGLDGMLTPRVVVVVLVPAMGDTKIIKYILSLLACFQAIKPAKDGVDVKMHMSQIVAS